MTRPGTRLRAMAARLFDSRTMERYVDPAIADLQTEYEETAQHGRRHERARVLVAGYIGVIQVISIQGGLKAIDILREPTADDRRAIRRTVLASAALMSISMMTNIAPFMRELWSHPRVVDLAVCLIPQAIPLSIPMGLTFGILWALGRLSASRTALVLVMILALGSSLVSFVTLAWVMPNANQAFRTATAGGPVAKGANELTIGELRERIQNPSPLSAASLSARPTLALNYHQRWALGATPFVLAMFAMILATGRKSGRAMPFVLSPILMFGYYTLMYAARELGLDRTIPPVAAAWVPNAVTMMLSAAVISVRLHRRKRNGNTANQPSLA
jgi:lipopolysaccharide export LptBFGC system permease protein LptF